MKKNRKRILIIDDDPFFCDMLNEIFSRDSSLKNEKFDLEIQLAHSKKEASPHYSKTKYDLILLDNSFPEESGLDFVSDILKFNEQVKIILITGTPSLENAIRALQNGIFDYILKPIEIEKLIHTVKRCFRVSELEEIEQVQQYKNKLEFEKTFLQIFSSGFDEIRFLVEKAAQSTVPVLITGETGTGKSVLAKYIHHLSASKKHEFVSINCATLPENLIESELFGVEKGAYTGAVSRKGLLEMADGGTLFLDEIAEIPLHLQSKLLGILDHSLVKRLGSEVSKSVQVRFIAATNVDLERLIDENKFRQDLYYRLNLIRIHVEPLRAKRHVIPQLCNFFLKELSLPEQEIILSEEEQKRLMEYSWPGNIRELKNILERALILRNSLEFQPSKFLLNSYKNTSEIEATASVSLLTLEAMESNYIQTVLKTMHGNITQTAKALGISISTLKRKLKP